MAPWCIRLPRPLNLLARSFDHRKFLLFSRKTARIRRGGRVVDGSGLENRQSESSRGFESHPLRTPNMFLFRHLPRFLAIVALVIQANPGRALAEEKSRALEIF